MLIAVVVVLVSGCSAATAPSSPPDEDSQAPATDESVPSATTGDSAGTSGSTDWCLNTVEEVSAALSVDVTDAAGAEAPGNGGGCNYSDADGNFVYSMSIVTASGAVGTFEANVDAEGAVTVDGIGDRAYLASPQGPLVVLKGDTLISIGAYTPAALADPAVYRSAVEELARPAVDRLP